MGINNYIIRMPGDSKQRKSTPEGENDKNQQNTTEQSSDDDSKKNPKKPDEKKHNSGAADLEKVTDFAEEKEINSSSTELTDAIANIRTKQAAATAEKLAREKELAKVSIKNEDVDLIVQELEIPKSKAERTLREFQGNVVEAMASLTN